MGFEGVTSVLLAERTIVGMPVAGPAVPLRKTLGAAGWIVTLRPWLMPPGVRSTMVASPAALNGSCALICEPETNIIGIGVPFTDRHESANSVGRGSALALSLIAANSVPNRLTSPPGATGCVKSAALTILVSCGGATAAS